MPYDKQIEILDYYEKISLEALWKEYVKETIYINKTGETLIDETTKTNSQTQCPSNTELTYY